MTPNCSFLLRPLHWNLCGFRRHPATTYWIMWHPFNNKNIVSGLGLKVIFRLIWTCMLIWGLWNRFSREIYLWPNGLRVYSEFRRSVENLTYHFPWTSTMIGMRKCSRHFERCAVSDRHRHRESNRTAAPVPTTKSKKVLECARCMIRKLEGRADGEKRYVKFVVEGMSYERMPTF